MLCEDPKEECFQEAASTLMTALALESVQTIRLHYSYDQEALEVKEHIRSALTSAEGKLGLLGPNLNFLVASYNEFRAVGFGWNKKQLCRAAYLALAITATIARRSSCGEKGGPLYRLRKAAQRAPTVAVPRRPLSSPDSSSPEPDRRASTTVQLKPAKPVQLKPAKPEMGSCKPGPYVLAAAPPAPPRPSAAPAPPSPPRPSSAAAPPSPSRPSSAAAALALHRRRSRSVAVPTILPASSWQASVPTSAPAEASHTRERRRKRKITDLVAMPSPSNEQRGRKGVRSPSCDSNDVPVLTRMRSCGVTVDVEEQKVFLDDMWGLLRSEITQPCVKEEVSSSPAFPLQHPQQPRGHISVRQRGLIQDMARGACLFDPAQNPSAMQQWEHKVRKVPVDLLRFTHNTVTERFRNGPHKGMKVTELTRQLVSGATTPDQITTLVVVLHKRVHNVVFGNRRLKALKDFAKQSQKNITMACIVHESGDAPKQLWAKFLDSSTTDNYGTSASFSNGRYRRET